MTFKTYALGVLGALTQGLNALLGGDRDQSFCSRSYEARSRGAWWAYLAVPILNFLFYPFSGSNHCLKAFLSDSERTYSAY